VSDAEEEEEVDDALTMPAVREAALRLCSTKGGPEHQPMVPWAVDGDGHAMEETVEVAWAAVMATPEMLPLHAAAVAQRLANNIAYRYLGRGDCIPLPAGPCIRIYGALSPRQWPTQG
jgi:hypothetical protein